MEESSHRILIIVRLIVNKTDGKLVELPSLQENSRGHFHNVGASSSTIQESGGTNNKNANDKENEDFMDSILKQYDYLLTSQLESQREYYEQQLVQAEKDRFVDRHILLLVAIFDTRVNLGTSKQQNGKHKGSNGNKKRKNGKNNKNNGKRKRKLYKSALLS